MSKQTITLKARKNWMKSCDRMNERRSLANAKIPELANNKAAKIRKKFRIGENTELDVEARTEGEYGAVYDFICDVLYKEVHGALVWVPVLEIAKKTYYKGCLATYGTSEPRRDEIPGGDSFSQVLYIDIDKKTLYIETSSKISIYLSKNNGSKWKLADENERDKCFKRIEYLRAIKLSHK